MSTEDESGPEFRMVPEESQQHFRLLELPADLLNVLTSVDAPTLKLKSQEGPSGNVLESQIVLCTPDKTYALRQVSTSNSVYVVRPGTSSNSSPDQPTLDAIAQPQSTLELQPAKGASAASYIKAALPTYTPTGHTGSTTKVSKQQLFANIPLSDGECEQVWTDLACFEPEGESYAIVPSDSVKLQAWEAMFATATAMGVDMTHSLHETSQREITTSETEWPEELSRALLRSMTAMPPSLPNEIQLDGDKSAQMLGRALLKDLTGSGQQPVSIMSFETKWADLLPERWRGKADIKLLEGTYKEQHGGETLTFIESEVSKEVAAASSAAAPAEAKSTLGAKRKWHEKFRASMKIA
ncbi:hypothetical protein LTR37_006665 [Vermiconidia calcicola]|uniref:Uncharacterized protein n=1 Tax=Vermiconidia calcicola TaxID=1690605 RepID=A0ACC3NGC8_9PEZI|nr:hypothetical protein LTR37_006665 [Vermiconidia calcicola]